MNDIECPYCGEEQEINHDDGYGYTEGDIHQQQCSCCDKYFTFTTSISYSYQVYQADCLNDGKHDFRATVTFPVECTKMECFCCGERRSPTEEEMEIIVKDHKDREERVKNRKTGLIK